VLLPNILPCPHDHKLPSVLTAIVAVSGQVTANQFGTLSNWSQVAASQNATFAVNSSGNLYGAGELTALGSAGGASPVLINSDIFLTTEGTLSANNSFGSVGNVFIIRSASNALVAWGDNSSGQLGQNNTTARANSNSPTVVGSNYSKVSVGSKWVVAVKTDGTLWAWGINSSGQLGQNNTTSYSSPVQIGSGTTWSDVAAGGDTMAIDARLQGITLLYTVDTANDA